LIDLNLLGAVVVKGVSIEPWNGNKTPRHVEVPGGMLNAIGLQNPGIEGFLANYLPALREYDVPVIVNIWGRTVDEYATVAERLSDTPGISGFEINISCPNIKEGGHAFGTDPRAAAGVVGAVRAKTRLPILTKLAPNVTDIRVFARIAEEQGSDAISLINSYPAMAIDIESRRPMLANITGGLSGPAIHPIAVKLVYEAARAVKIPVVAMGGIQSARDAIEFIIAGARAVAVGTSNFTDPGICLKLVDGIADYLDRHSIATVAELSGTVRL
jgi:dihydroorotate dehydrogenase (NAD+) catalytic subunit